MRYTVALAVCTPPQMTVASLTIQSSPLPVTSRSPVAVNESRQKPVEAFSPLRPIKDFGKALGFVGPPDPYETAKQGVEATRAETTPAQAAAAGDGDKPAGDFPIQATITKSSGGQNDAKATLGTESKEINKSADKSDKKKPKKNGSTKSNGKKAS